VVGVSVIVCAWEVGTMDVLAVALWVACFGVGGCVGPLHVTWDCLGWCIVACLGLVGGVYCCLLGLCVGCLWNWVCLGWCVPPCSTMVCLLVQ
jgi:hypothetical protein